LAFGSGWTALGCIDLNNNNYNNNNNNINNNNINNKQCTDFLDFTFQNNILGRKANWIGHI
jgi:hypothetical protein